MTNIKLQNELEKLRIEVNKVANDDIDVRDRLNSLISDTEKKLGEPTNENHHNNLVLSIKDAIRRFETGHPRATGILNDIMVTLSNMGI